MTNVDGIDSASFGVKKLDRAPLSHRSKLRIKKIVESYLFRYRTSHDTPSNRIKYVGDLANESLRALDLDDTTRNKINKYLGLLGYKLGPKGTAKDSVICFGDVTRHTDHSGILTFIPILLPRKQIGEFQFLHEDGSIQKIPLGEGEIVSFDQSKEHAYRISLNEDDTHMGYGIVMFLEKIPE